MDPKFTTDMVVLWTGAIIFALAGFLFYGISVHEDTWRDTLGGCLPLLFIVAAIVLTVLRCIGLVGPFFGRY